MFVSEGRERPILRRRHAGSTVVLWRRLNRRVSHNQRKVRRPVPAPAAGGRDARAPTGTATGRSACTLPLNLMLPSTGDFVTNPVHHQYFVLRGKGGMILVRRTFRSVG